MNSLKLIAIFFVVFVVGIFFAVKSFAQQAPPPVFGCLGLGGQQCSFLQVGPPKINLTVNGKPLKGTKRIIHYGDTVKGSVNYTNTGSLPMNINKVGVAAKTIKGKKYEVLFTPSQGQTVLQPGQSISLATTFHKFNYPDPPGDWTVAGRVVNTDNQSVDGNNPDTFTLVADCTPLRATDPSADADNLNAYCAGKTEDALCKEFCEVKPDLAKNCGASEPGQMPPDGQDPSASQPGQQAPQAPGNGDQGQQPQPNQDTVPDASNPGQPKQPNPENQNTEGPNEPPANEPNEPVQPEEETDEQNVIQQLQKQFQQFLDELRRLIGGNNL